MAFLLLFAWGTSPAAAHCAGDCNGDRAVAVDELVRGVNIALGTNPVSACPSFDVDGDAAVTVDELVGAMQHALGSCPQCDSYDPQRNAYFGDLHVHTALSYDVYAFGVDTTPARAYRFALGDPVSLPPLDAEGKGTQTIRIDRRLDFVALTDHSEFLGEVDACTTAGSPGYDSTACQTYRVRNNNAIFKFGITLTAPRPHSTEICGRDGTSCAQLSSQVWEEVKQAAQDANDTSPQCTFTAFVAFEYSNSSGVSTLHRNVIFRNDQVPLPGSYFDQPTAQELWAYLKASCLDAHNGCDVLAIPHNSNESNGKMFAVEYPGARSVDDERAQATFRAAMEPVVEVFQHKGDSECMNGLSRMFGAPDELCDFEKRRRPPFDDCGDGVGRLGIANSGCVSRNDFVRGALLTGLKEARRLGVNPYPLGIIASSDTHNGTPGAVTEGTFIGHRGFEDDTPARRLGHGMLQPGGVIFNPGGLAGVWAEENSRASLFDAIRRREVFGTSGPRITVRFFGGWGLPDDLCTDPNLVRVGYARGVPMGGVLPGNPAAVTAPSFVISALRDPGTDSRPAVPLQRLQVVKGWIENGDAHYQVYDVAGNPSNGASVDTDTCAPIGIGADALCTVWTDPAFSADQEAFYYVRVVENPTCRWSAYTCSRLPPDQRPDTCSDPAVPKTIQERAWTSPIWFHPEG